MVKRIKFWKEKCDERVWLRQKLVVVFSQCTHLTHWNSLREQPLVHKANLVRYRDIWERWQVFTDWRKNLWRDACDHYARVFYAFYTRECMAGWKRYIVHRHEHYARLRKAEAHHIRRRKRVAVRDIWNPHRLRRREYIRVLLCADKVVARRRQTTHIRAWQQRAAFQTVMKRNAKKALGYLRNIRTVKTFRTLARNAVQRRRARVVVHKLIDAFNRRESEMPFMTWKTNAAIMTAIIQDAAATEIQKQARILLARWRVTRLVAKKHYLFETNVGRELNVTEVGPTDIDQFLRRHDLVLIHYYIPWDDVPARRDAYSRAASWTALEAAKWLQRHVMCTPRETPPSEWEQQEWGAPAAPLEPKIAFAKANVAAMDSEDYGRSLGVRMNVPKTPTIRAYWRHGRGDTIDPLTGDRVSKLPDAKDSPTWSFLPEDFAEVDLFGTGKDWDPNNPATPAPKPVTSQDDLTHDGRLRNGRAIQDWVRAKLERVLEIEIKSQIEIARWARGHHVRAVIVPNRKAEAYWEKQPLWVRQKNKRTGEIEFYNRVSGETTVERPDVYVTPREEREAALSLAEQMRLAALEGGELPTAMQFKDAVVCMVCQENIAAWKCLDACDVPMCDGCTNDSHRSGAYAGHKCVAVDVKAMHNNKRMCGECEVRVAHMFCVQCLDTYCRDCYADAHATGRRQFHKYTLMSEKNAMRVPKDQRDKIVSTKAHDIVLRREWKTLRIMEAELAETMRLAEAKRKRLDEFREVVKEAFDKYDEDDSGTMEIDELERLLEHELREPVEHEELQKAIQEMDADGNGVVDFEEFLDWFTSPEIRNRNVSLKLRAMRFRLRVRARARNGAQATEEAAKRAAKIAAKRIAEARAKVKARVDVAAAKIAKAKAKVYAKLPERLRKAYEAPPRVPNTSVGPITIADFDRLQEVFIRWTKEKFLLDIPYHGFLNKRKAMDAFEEVFVPNWNNGDLDVWHYHDGRRFALDDETWVQTWNNEEGQFEYQAIDPETDAPYKEEPEILHHDPKVGVPRPLFGGSGLASCFLA